MWCERTNKATNERITSQANVYLSIWTRYLSIGFWVGRNDWLFLPCAATMAIIFVQSWCCCCKWTTRRNFFLFLWVHHIVYETISAFAEKFLINFSFGMIFDIPCNYYFKPTEMMMKMPIGSHTQMCLLCGLYSFTIRE